MSNVIRQACERKSFKSTEERNLFLDKMGAWFDRLFDAWEGDVTKEMQQLRALGLTEEELNEAIAQIESRPDHLNPKRKDD